MCMSHVTWKAETKKNYKSKVKWQTGYKVFNFIPPGIKTLYHDSDVISLTEINIATTNKYADMDVDVGYTVGWHLFTTIEDAKIYAIRSDNYVVYKIKYRKVMAIGTQYTGNTKHKTIVAKEMKIVKLLYPYWATHLMEK
jgi:hypothetical protein